MAKQLTCLLVMVLALVFVWADDGASPTPSISTPTIPSTNGTSATGVTFTPKILQENSSVPAIATDPPAPTTILQGISCDSFEDSCTTCVRNNCTFIQESYGPKCTNDSDAFDQFTLWISHSVEECPTTETTTLPATTNTTTGTTTSTTPPTTTTTTSTTVPTTTTATTTTKPTNATTPSTPAPTTTAKPAVPTTPAPSKGGSWGWGPFFAGIAFAAGLSSVGYVLWRFYKVRTERNYHTL